MENTFFHCFSCLILECGAEDDDLIESEAPADAFYVGRLGK